MSLSRNQGTLLVSGIVTAFTLIKEIRLQREHFESVKTFNSLFQDFAAWYEQHGKHLGVNEFHREFKKHFEFVEVAKRAIR